MADITFHVDTHQLEQAFDKYKDVTSRTLSDAVNEKLFFIAKNAVWQTHKASEADIRSDFGQATVLVRRKDDKGFRKSKNKSKFTAQAKQHKAPLIAVIINKRKGKAGEKGLYGSAMLAATRKMFAARMRSIAFLRAGWIPSIKKLARFSKYGATKGPPVDMKIAKGQPKGFCVPATPSSLIGRIENQVGEHSGPRSDAQSRALQKWGSQGLQRAIDQEVASMEKYMEDKMAPDIIALNNEMR